MAIIRKKIIIRGIVQGVGFRPNVYKLALKNHVFGWVKNNGEGVVIEAESDFENVKKFIDDLKRKKPPQSKINSINISNGRVKKEKSFLILKSGGKNSGASAIIPADLSICEDCRTEILKISNRRYLYPFTNCTNCGPRFTIVKDIPYDRPRTTMKKFKMCSSCKKEYENPLDRRFHAQPNACPDCGPRVFSSAGRKKLEGLDALNAATEMIISGGICSLQSLGGFHIACDALNKKAVSKIRKYKLRPSKPFALMVSNLKEAEKICHINSKEKEILKSAASPVVMLKKKKRNLYENAAPGLNTLGIMIPYTPLHEALFQLLRSLGFQNPLIMTSGNRRDEPIAKTILRANEKLKGLIDLALYNDRNIHNRIDDSVGFVMEDSFYLIRRARGYVPGSIKMPIEGKSSVLAYGADLKNTFCLTRGSHAFVSQHMGDLSETENQDFQSETISKFKKLLSVKPRITVCDTHPNYHSTLIAQKTNARQIKVQHHLAHILSVAAEHQIKKPFMGLALDGTGYGADSNIWGCEFMEIQGKKAKRAAHLKYFPLPGGDIASSEIWRGALSLVKMNNLDKKFQKKSNDFFKLINKNDLNLVSKMIDANINSTLTSSMGRLFDAVAFLAGIRKLSDYEAQAAMELESLCEKKPKNFYNFLISLKDNKIIIDPLPVIAEIIKSGAKKNRAKIISEKFHMGVSVMIAEVFEKLRRKNGISDIALSGGVFQNRIILEWTMAALKKKGFRVYTNKELPSNDACVSLGQAFAVMSQIRLD